MSDDILNVGLFEGRHKWPTFVHEFIFEERKDGYDPRDFNTFEAVATIKLLNWKAQGVRAINLYLSGLIGATIAVLNAAYSVGIYVKLFHYSNIIDKWISQTVEFLPIPKGIVFKTQEELIAEEEEKRTKDAMSERERRLIVKYVNIYTKLQEHFNPDLFTWEDVYAYIVREYPWVNKEYILLMKPYFSKGGAAAESESYNDRIRSAIESNRGKQQPKIPVFQFSSFRRTGGRHRKH